MNLKDFLNYLKSLIRITIRLSVALIIFSVFTQVIRAQERPIESKTTIDTSKFVMKKSPWGAVLRSAILPGLGQFYNESYWKIPVVWGFLGYLGYQWNSLNNLYKHYGQLYDQTKGQPSTSGNSVTPDYKAYRDFERDQRDQFAVFIGLTYFLNLVDAYVDAQLFDFNVSEDQFGQKMQISLKVKF